MQELSIDWGPHWSQWWNGELTAKRRFKQVEQLEIDQVCEILEIDQGRSGSTGIWRTGDEVLHYLPLEETEIVLSNS
jgi:hypothetical protein